MEGFENGFIQLELKYCERCGGLWLRPRDSELAFCGRCAKAIAGLRVQLNDADPSLLKTQQSAFWGEGGNA